MPSLQPDPVDAPRPPPTPDASVDALYVRNYDVEAAHTVTVTFTGVDTDATFRRRYYLSPGQAEHEAGVLPAGTYDVVVFADGYDHAAARVDVGPSTGESALVELGNGITSLTQGGY